MKFRDLFEAREVNIHRHLLQRGSPPTGETEAMTHEMLTGQHGFDHESHSYSYTKTLGVNVSDVKKSLKGLGWREKGTRKSKRGNMKKMAAEFVHSDSDKDLHMEAFALRRRDVGTGVDPSFSLPLLAMPGVELDQDPAGTRTLGARRVDVSPWPATFLVPLLLYTPSD